MSAPARRSPFGGEEKKRRVRSGRPTAGSKRPTFVRSGAEIVVARAAAAGLEGDFAGHSLRAGVATAAARAGRSEAAIMRHGRWKSVQIRPPLHPTGHPLGR